MIEFFAQNYAFSKEKTIGKDATPSYEDFTNKILPAMFDDRPYIRVTYNTDMKIWEWQKKYRKSEKQAKGIHLDNIINSENIALWYKINPNWINYCQKIINTNKPAYIILSQIKDKELHFCVAEIDKIHTVLEIYDFPKQGKDIFKLSQEHESNNLYNFKPFETFKDEQQAKIIKWLVGKETGQDPLTEKRSAITYKQRSEIVTIPNFAKLDRELVGNVHFFYNREKKGIATLTHSNIEIHVDKYGKIFIGNQEFFANSDVLKTLFLFALCYKLEGKNIVTATISSNSYAINKMQQIYMHTSGKEIDEEKIRNKVAIILISSNLSGDLTNLNKELDKYFPDSMYHLHKDIKSNHIKFKQDFDKNLIMIEQELKQKIVSSVK